MNDAKLNPLKRILDLVDWSQNERVNGSKSYEEILLTFERRAAAIGMGMTVHTYEQINSPAHNYQPHLFGIGVPEIVAYVAKVYGFTVENLTNGPRTKNLAFSRHVAMYLCRTRTDASLHVIGRFFNKHHSTVLNGVSRIEAVMDKDYRMVRDIDNMNAALDAMAEKLNLEFMEQSAELQVTA